MRRIIYVIVIAAAIEYFIKYVVKDYGFAGELLGNTVSAFIVPIAITALVAHYHYKR